MIAYRAHRGTTAFTLDAFRTMMEEENRKQELAKREANWRKIGALDRVKAILNVTTKEMSESLSSPLLRKTMPASMLGGEEGGSAAGSASTARAGPGQKLSFANLASALIQRHVQAPVGGSLDDEYAQLIEAAKRHHQMQSHIAVLSVSSHLKAKMKKHKNKMRAGFDLSATSRIFYGSVVALESLDGWFFTIHPKTGSYFF
jgi:hypothetical protein